MKNKLTQTLKYIFSDGGESGRAVITIKKKTLLTIGVIGAAAFCALLFIFSTNSAGEAEARPAPTQITFTKSDMDVSGIDLMGSVIVIDAAHGIGVDYNVSDSGVSEEELALWIAKAVKADLESRNATVILTRTNPNALGQDKKADAEIRNAVIEGSNADLAVSIHANWYDDPAAKGAQTFYANAAGEKAATAILDMINYKMEYEYPRIPIDGNYTVFEVKSLPVCVVEAGFLSNEDDAALLADEEYREKIAGAISEGIMLYEKRLRQWQ